MATSSTSFQRGNAGGPGRKKKTDAERSVLELVRDGVSEEDVVAIFRAQVNKAKRGDTRAAQLVLSYRVGNPSQDLNVSVSGELLLLDMPWPKEAKQS